MSQGKGSRNRLSNDQLRKFSESPLFKMCPAASVRRARCKPCVCRQVKK
jgi:hypothetical protein